MNTVHDRRSGFETAARIANLRRRQCLRQRPLPLLVSSQNRKIPDEWINDDITCQYCSLPMTILDTQSSHLLYNCPSGSHQLDRDVRRPKRQKIIMRLASLAQSDLAPSSLSPAPSGVPNTPQNSNVP